MAPLASCLRKLFALYIVLPCALCARQPFVESSIVSDGNGCFPLQVHIGLGKSNTEMHVSWKTGASSCASEVTIHDAEEDAPSGAGLGTNTIGYNFLLSHKDMCAAPAADNEFVLQLHRVHVKNLVPGRRYSYRVAGSDEEHTFTASPEVSPREKFTFAAFGDLGDPHYERAKSPGSVHTLRALREDASNLDLILHVGDISYANGDPDIWDSFMDSIEPLSKSIPYMVAIGNHEYDYIKGDYMNDPSGGKPYDPDWGNYGEDSGGECGVMTARRFYTPARTPRDNPPFWYGFSYGSVHFTVISTEHDLSPGSTQYEWLESELAGVDRCLTPWLVLLMHRPMYVVYPHKSNRMMGEHFQASFEHLLESFRVDAVISGHVHSYYRSCAVYHNDCRDGSYHGVPGTPAAAAAAGGRGARGRVQEEALERSAAAEVAGAAGVPGECLGALCSPSSSSSSKNGLEDGNKGPKHGTVHFVIGSAGHKLSDLDRGQEDWVLQGLMTWGYGRFTVDGSDMMLMEFVESETGRVVDELKLRQTPLAQQQCSSQRAGVTGSSAAAGALEAEAGAAAAS